MKEKLIVSTLIVLFLSVSCFVPVGIVTGDDESTLLMPEKQHKVAQATVVLIDESHGGHTHDGLLANMTTDLEAHGYAVENMTSWSESALYSADVVVIPFTSIPYTMDEYYVLHHFVAKGGGLFIISDVPTASTADELAEEFGYRFYSSTLRDHDDHLEETYYIKWDRVSNFADHPITEGVSNVTTYVGYGIYRFPGLSVPLLMMDADTNSDFSDGQLSCGVAQLIATEYSSGMGRIVVTGDINQFGAVDITGNGNSEYYEADNALLARNIIDWLAGAAVPNQFVVFDETHTPVSSIYTRSSSISILFEEVHNPMFDMYSDYSDLRDYLRGNRMSPSTMSFWSSSDLMSTEVIVLANPSNTYGVSDTNDILREVRAGAGLLLIGEVGQFLGAGATQIAELFGVEFYDGGLNDTDDNYGQSQRILMDGTNLADHPALRGVHEVGYIFGGGFRTVPDNAMTILRTDDDSSSGWTDAPPGSPSARNVPCAIAFAYGRGRVMMIADGNLFTNPYIEFGNNSLFAISALRWLGGGESLGYYYHAAQSLRDQGLGVFSMKQFDSTFLEGTDALIMAPSFDPYSAAEKAVIEEYVTAQGNGLFILGATSTYGDNMRDVAADYGIHFDSQDTNLHDDDDFASTTHHGYFLLDELNIGTHAITQGVDELLWAQGIAIGKYPGNAEVILEMDNDAFSVWENGTPAAQAAMMVAVGVGNGRVIALGDYSIWNGYVHYTDNYGDLDTMTIDVLDNSRLMTNAVVWLVGAGGGPILPFSLPWWAIPVIGAVALVTIVGGVALRETIWRQEEIYEEEDNNKEEVQDKDQEEVTV